MASSALGAALNAGAEGEREQGPHDARPPLDAESVVAALTGALEALEAVARASLEAWCSRAGVPFDEALRSFGDRGHAGAQAGGKSKSVLNLYHYFNEAEAEEEPCRAHADPGLVTLLCRSTNPGLQVQLPLRPGGAPGRRAAYEECWRDAEPAMDACRGAGGCVLLAAVGESLERLSGCATPSCRHRVARTPGPRFNLAYEMRPRANLWHPWPALAGPGEGGAGGGARGGEAPPDGERWGAECTELRRAAEPAVQPVASCSEGRLGGSARTAHGRKHGCPGLPERPGSTSAD